MMYRPYERKNKHPKPVLIADAQDWINDFCHSNGVFIWFHHIYEILDVSQFVLNQRGHILYGIVALESKFDKDGNVIDANYDYVTSTIPETGYRAAQIWYQASGKPQVTFEETRQKMIDEFLALQ